MSDLITDWSNKLSGKDTIELFTKVSDFIKTNVIIPCEQCDYIPDELKCYKYTEAMMLISKSIKNVRRIMNSTNVGFMLKLTCKNIMDLNIDYKLLPTEILTALGIDYMDVSRRCVTGNVIQTNNLQQSFNNALLYKLHQLIRFVADCFIHACYIPKHYIIEELKCYLQYMYNSLFNIDLFKNVIINYGLNISEKNNMLIFDETHDDESQFCNFEVKQYNVKVQCKKFRKLLPLTLGCMNMDNAQCVHEFIHKSYDVMKYVIESLVRAKQSIRYAMKRYKTYMNMYCRKLYDTRELYAIDMLEYNFNPCFDMEELDKLFISEHARKVLITIMNVVSDDVRMFT